MNNSERVDSKLLDEKAFLRRYTNLASLIHILSTKKLTLLSPDSWDDRNDTYFISIYKQRVKAKAVFVLCFTYSKETYHHWYVFSKGSDGVCIEFDKDILLQSVEKYKVKHDEVIYERIDSLAKNGVEDAKLPFIKRLPYEPECEYRLILEYYRKKEINFMPIDIDLASIKRITLSPWMPKSLAKYVKSTLRAIQDCSNLEISRSTLINNERWKSCSNTIKSN